MPAHTKSAKCNSEIAVIGIDIGKNVFHLIGLDSRGAIVLKRKLSRSQLESFVANLPPCLIGMEACAPTRKIVRRAGQASPIAQRRRVFCCACQRAPMAANSSATSEIEALKENRSRDCSKVSRRR